VGGPLSTASRPHLAPYSFNDSGHAGHTASGGSRGTPSTPHSAAAGSSSSRRTTTSEPGSGIGRNRQPQSQQLGIDALASPQQRLSLAIPNPAARGPGFVRSAAAALSVSGGRSPSSVAGTPVGATGSRRSPSSRESQQQQQRQMLTSNPLYDGVDG
jgi:hypothetical protein